MEYVSLPGTELKVSRLAFGCGALGGHDHGKVDVNEIIKAVRIAFDRGINFFDTANVYGLGQSEELLAKALGKDRKRAIILKYLPLHMKNRIFF